MATTRSFVGGVLELAGLGSALAAKKMFGEYALYLDGKVVAMACDNRLYVKPSPATEVLVPRLPEGPPYPRGKPHAIADALLDEPEALRALLLATAAQMPEPAAKKPSARPKRKPA